MNAQKCRNTTTVNVHETLRVVGVILILLSFTQLTFAESVSFLIQGKIINFVNTTRFASFKKMHAFDIATTVSCQSVFNIIM